MDLKPLFNDLVRFETELWDALDRRLRSQLDLSMGGLDVMRVVERTPACRVYDIARELSITVGGTSKAVDRIEAAGHILRRSNPADRRSSIVELTPAGQSLLTRATNVFEAELELRLGSAVDDDALAQMAATLARLRKNGTP